MRSRRMPIARPSRAMRRAFCMRAPSAVWPARRRFSPASPLDSCLSDHFRSRLTHTLEVAQISRTLAGRLGLNAELAEALALVHDIGHPPFGHAGEKALDTALARTASSFDHNLHALRIVTWFEERYPAFRGLNLTLAVREGIIKHSRDYSQADHPELAEYFLDQFPPLEAQLIDLADEIAYLTADLDDGLDSGILALDDVRDSRPALPRAFTIGGARAISQRRAKTVRLRGARRMLNVLVTDLIERSARAGWLRSGATTLDEIRRAPARLAALSPAMEADRAAAKKFLYANFYNSPGHGRGARARGDESWQELFASADGRPGTAARRPPGADSRPRPCAHRRRLHRRNDRQLHRADVDTLCGNLKRQDQAARPLLSIAANVKLQLQALNPQ